MVKVELAQPMKHNCSYCKKDIKGIPIQIAINFYARMGEYEDIIKYYHMECIKELNLNGKREEDI